MVWTVGFLENNGIEKVSEYRICKWTGETFPIYEKDVEMLKKISPSVGDVKLDIPLPTLSPKARQIRRLLFRNERNFYKSRSNKTGEPMISLYALENTAKVFEQKEWWQQDWDPMDFGFEVDVSMSISRQFYQLRQAIPRLNMVTVDNENSEYTTGTGYCKNCYLINSSEDSEDCYYGKLFQNCKKCVDCSYVYDSEKLYQCLNVKKGYNSVYVHNSSECADCYYSDDLIGCHHCMFCSNLRNASYCFENEQLSKEEWQERVRAYLGTRSHIESGIQKFEQVIQKKLTKYASVVNSVNSYGDVLIDDKNCAFCYDVNNSEDCRYVNVGVEVKDNMDCNNMYIQPERSYEVLGTIGTYNVHFCTFVFNCSHLLYCQDCYDSKSLFGCIGLRNKEYCIFNTQYTKEEYEVLVPKIIKQMKVIGEWGEYFHPQATAFPYNDSLAMEYFPVKEVVNVQDGEITERKGIHPLWSGIVYVLEPEKTISKAKLDLGGEEKIDILWKTKEKEIGIPDNTYFVEAKDLAENISDESEEVFKKAIKCARTGRPFRITPQEFYFYQDIGMPLPIYHPDVRYYDRLAYRPKRELHVQSCTKCQKEVLSVYGKEKNVYCEECYNKEVY